MGPSPRPSRSGSTSCTLFTRVYGLPLFKGDAAIHVAMSLDGSPDLERVLHDLGTAGRTDKSNNRRRTNQSSLARGSLTYAAGSPRSAEDRPHTAGGASRHSQDEQPAWAQECRRAGSSSSSSSGRGSSRQQGQHSGRQDAVSPTTAVVKAALPTQLPHHTAASEGRDSQLAHFMIC
jgi:hypothetical protein